MNMRRFTQFNILVLALCFLFPNILSAASLRTRSFSDRQGKIGSAFKELDHYTRDALEYGILPESALPRTSAVLDILAAMIVNRISIMDADRLLEAKLPGHDPETIHEAAQEVLRVISIAREPQSIGERDRFALRLGNEVLAEMYAMVKGIHDELHREIEVLLKQGKRGTIANYIEKRLSSYEAIDKRKYSKPRLNILRFDLAEWLINADQPALAIAILEHDQPRGNPYHHIYKIRYYHLLARAYEHEAISRQHHGEPARALQDFRQSEEYLTISLDYAKKEEIRLWAVPIGAQDEANAARQKGALEQLGLLRRGMLSDVHFINCCAVRAMTLLADDLIDRRELADRIRRIRYSDLRDDESLEDSRKTLNVVRRRLPWTMLPQEPLNPEQLMHGV